MNVAPIHVKMVEPVLMMSICTHVNADMVIKEETIVRQVSFQ